MHMSFNLQEETVGCVMLQQMDFIQWHLSHESAFTLLSAVSSFPWQQGTCIGDTLQPQQPGTALPSCSTVSILLHSPTWMEALPSLPIILMDFMLLSKLCCFQTQMHLDVRLQYPNINVKTSVHLWHVGTNLIILAKQLQFRQSLCLSGRVMKRVHSHRRMLTLQLGPCCLMKRQQGYFVTSAFPCLPS